MQMLEEAESMPAVSGMKSSQIQSAFDSLFDSGDDIQDVDDGEYTSEQVEAPEDLSNLEETNG